MIDGSKSIDTDAGLRCVAGPRRRCFCNFCLAEIPVRKARWRSRAKTPAFVLDDVHAPLPRRREPLLRRGVGSDA